MRAALLLLVAVACKGKDAEPAPPPITPVPVDAAPPATEWAACERALRAAPKLPANRRVQSLIEHCRPCGDWSPLLRWHTEGVDGGPSRAEIEQAMLACSGYCDKTAKQRFLGTLDSARGKNNTRGPWRYLGEVCKAQVSAVPDTRYMSAPYFALDRIARAVAARPELAPLLDAIELPLPALTVSGAGFELAKSPVTAPDVGPIALTVTATEVRVAATPRAKLGKDGVVLLGKGEPYPGSLVKTPTDIDGAGAIAVFTPFALPATSLLPALALVPGREVRLAVTAKTDLPDWPNTGTIPIALDTRAAPAGVRIALGADPDVAIEQALARKADMLAAAKDPSRSPVAIELGPKATIGGLAKLLGAIAYFDIKSAALVKGK